MVALLEPTTLLEDFQLLAEQKSTGELILSNQNLVCNFHFINGRLMYVADNLHPIRRLKRALGDHDFVGFLSLKEEQENKVWQSELLYQAISKKQLHLTDVKQIITKVATECIMELGSYANLQKKWQPQVKSELSFFQLLALSPPEIVANLSPVIQSQEKGETDNLSQINPSLVPVLKQGIKEKNVTVFSEYLNGKYTIWDVSKKLNKSVTQMIKLLSHLATKKIIELKQVNDLNITDLTGTILNNIPSKKTEKKTLIAVIDANELIGHKYQQILGDHGYKILNINEPMRGFGQLVDSKPDVIFIDLSLQNVDGYSVCRFLRQSEVFATTPIVILTENDSQINLVRGKIFGATDFLVKSQAENKLLNLVSQYSK